jgi:hypothetical protein
MPKEETRQRELVENDGAPGLRVRPRLSRHRTGPSSDDGFLPDSEYRRLLRRIQTLEDEVEKLKAAVGSQPPPGS